MGYGSAARAILMYIINTYSIIISTIIRLFDRTFSGFPAFHLSIIGSLLLPVLLPHTGLAKNNYNSTTDKKKTKQ